MDTILYTVVVAFAIAFIFGFLLGLFKKIFFVKTDPKIEEVRNALSGANCGGCGLAGCDAFASAVVKGDAPVNGCVAGGADCASKISSILGQANVEVVPKVSVLLCKGTKECAGVKGEYHGLKTCKAAQMVMNGTKKCSYGCIGFGDCVKECPFDALKLNDDGLPVVDFKKCVGCGNCVTACPKHLFQLVNSNLKGSIALCSNKSDNKPQIRKDCTNGCFKCGLCTKKCPQQCIDISSGLPVIDYTKCNSCGECVKACTDHVLCIVQDSLFSF